MKISGGGCGGFGLQKRRRWRWTPERRAIVLATLEDTGNLTAAGLAAGTSFNAINRLRKREPEFDRQCEEAARAAHERLAAATDPFAEGDGFHMIQRSSNGRYQLSAVRKNYWCKRHDDLFFQHLRRTGNICAAARATGFDPSVAWERFHRWLPSPSVGKRRWKRRISSWNSGSPASVAAGPRRDRTAGREATSRRGGGTPEEAVAGPAFDPDSPSNT